MRRLVILAFFSGIPMMAAVASPGTEMAQKFEGEARTAIHLQYLLFLPATYDEDPHRRWPLILYLHGGSLRGDDVNKLRTLGLPHRLEQDRQFPFVVLAPLCPEGEIWTDSEALTELLGNVIRENRIDERRVYVTGHSMGGRGALYLAYKYPERFAAVVAMSPLSPITAWAKRLSNLPLWIIHGAKDTNAPIKDSEELVSAIEHSGGHPKFTRLADRDHFILDLYGKNDVLDWMAGHSRQAQCRDGRSEILRDSSTSLGMTKGADGAKGNAGWRSCYSPSGILAPLRTGEATFVRR